MTRSLKLAAAGAVAVAALALSGPVLLASQGSSGQAGVEISGTCRVAKVSFATAESHQATSSTTFADLPGTAVTFRIPGTGRTCLKVAFSAEAFAPNDAAITVRALLDGNVIGSPLLATLAADGGDLGLFSSHAMNFAFDNVAPGTHTVKIQWRAFGGEVEIFVRSLFVHHR